MTTIPQRLREIAARLRKPRDGRPWGADDGAADLLDAIADEFESATAADPVPVVAVITSYARGNELNYWDRAAMSLPVGEYKLVTEAAHLAAVAALQARINALEARQAPESAKDRHIVVWPSGSTFTAGSLRQAQDYMDGAMPRCIERGDPPPTIVRYAPAETVPYEPQPDTSKEQT